MEYATFNFTASQQLVQQATAVRAKKPEEVQKEARACVVSEGGDPGNATLVLSRHSIQFGKYQGQTFKWLLENDAGYALQLVHSHQRERETNTMTSPLMANKDALAQYSCAHQVFISHLKFHRAHEEARAFVKWLRRKTPQPGTAMDAARKYILRRDAERPAATAAGSSSSSSTSTSTTTTAGASSFSPFPTSSTSTAATRGSEGGDAVGGGHPGPSAGAEEEEAEGEARGAANIPTIPESWRTTLSREQQEWVGRALFTIDSRGKTSLTTDLNLWWDPPQPRPTFAQPPASPAAFFACRFFLWMPVRIWGVRPACAQPGCNRPFTKAGLYQTIRRVLDIDGWYLMATEYLECRRCQRKLSCDRRVISMLRERTRGNSATQLYKKLCEVHSETWMRRSTHYLSVMEPFLTSGVVRACTPPPSMPPFPQPGWLLTVYGHDILSRLEDVEARVTSIFGKVLKMDSTKKVTRKLAGAAAGTAAWVTNVGNEHGQVLMSMLTAREGAGLLPMAAGIVRRYRDAGVEPPQLLYVDRDCCSSFGGSRAAAMFAEWEGLVVRLDIWHLMRRFASGELIGIEYLYSQTGRVLQDISLDPDVPDAEGNVPLSPPTEEGFHVAQEEDYRGPDDQPGYLAVVKLATALVGLRSEAALSERRVDELIELYEALSPYDRARVHYPPRHRDRPAQGRFKAAKSAQHCCCLVGQTSGPATWPSASRVVEAVCTQLCNIYPSGTRVYGSRRTRWDSILLHYRHIRDLVLGHQRLMARAPIQLFGLNQRTLSLWYVHENPEGEGEDCVGTSTRRCSRGTTTTSSGSSSGPHGGSGFGGGSGSSGGSGHVGGGSGGPSNGGGASPSCGGGVPAYQATGGSSCPGRAFDTTSRSSCSRTFWCHTVPGPLCTPPRGDGAPSSLRHLQHHNSSLQQHSSFRLLQQHALQQHRLAPLVCPTP
ncbi:hypothetical protein ACEWY4_022364 [Coilia grayii]|uniref:DUF6729 domain-containing protein n=1 Tax=Coilia grayii TaxID=363190 RepID=A0ABD1J793_9TELE